MAFRVIRRHRPKQNFPPVPKAEHALAPRNSLPACLRTGKSLCRRCHDQTASTSKIRPNSPVRAALVVQGVNSMTFAARGFRPRQGASDAHIPCGSVRSEQRRLGRKEPPPEGLRRIWPGASLLVGHSPTGGGCSLLAPRPRPNWAQETSSYLRPGPLRVRAKTSARQEAHLEQKTKRLSP